MGSSGALLVLPGATGDCGDDAGLGIGAEEKGSSWGPLKAEVICVHSELMLSFSPSTSGTGGGNATGKLREAKNKYM